jgi:hypothetical protein
MEMKFRLLEDREWARGPSEIPPRQLVNRPRLDQLEEPDLRLKGRAVRALHVKDSRHRAKGSRQRTPGSVFESLACFEQRLFPDDTRSVNFLNVSRSIDDGPVAVQQLNRHLPFVGNTNGVEEEPATGIRIAVFIGIAGTNTDSNTAGLGLRRGLKKIFITHAAQSSSHDREGRHAGLPRKRST